MVDIDDDWESFLHNDDDDDDMEDSNESLLLNNGKFLENNQSSDVRNIPKCSSLYISTKTKISYLNMNNIDIKDIFWKVPVLKYYTPRNGVIKKQMKFNFSDNNKL